MADIQTRFEQLLAKLRLMDYRLTPQRLYLVRLITNSEDHPSAAQLFEQVKVQFPTMSLATVYKTIYLLKELGEVVEISLHDDNHFDAKRPYPHPHLICTSCKKISDGQLEAPNHALLDEMEHISGFQILCHQLVFYGLCPDCQKNI
ncbi:MAG: transcriptional repressor [Chloroflexi bacterium RBG_13_50_21]|nr:MAG: transcriptional repressor [Chloroflexi bacterium RBG_13_50_21]